ncbi:MAG: shikimate dehydrogenase, partial [Gammaproteobacteria bacterium]|nr:shikimate dehydrogenase [Gammaproteobacteria bacterium]
MTSRLAVLGRPVEHSRSPEIHRQFADQTGIDLDYRKVLVPEGEFVRVAREFLLEGLGFNVTLPCKQDAFEFVDMTSGAARVARAVNTVIKQDGVVAGDNTDGPGLVRDISCNLGWPIEGGKVLILGAGGAVSGILGSLLDEAPGEIHLFNRTADKAVALADRFGDPRLKAVGKASLDECYPLVINGTSAGLLGESLDLPETIIGRASRCYDMTYAPGVTRFNRWCSEVAGCETSDGLGMLVE